jgi:uncharacterized protein YjbI with pentapeptide repeats
MNNSLNVNLNHSLVLDLHGAFLRDFDFSKSRLVRANFARTNFENSKFCGSDFEGANLDGTNFIGADLTDAKNLTAQQLKTAIIDETTILPSYLTLEQIKSVV